MLVINEKIQYYEEHGYVYSTLTQIEEQSKLDEFLVNTVKQAVNFIQKNEILLYGCIWVLEKKTNFKYLKKIIKIINYFKALKGVVFITYFIVLKFKKILFGNKCK